MNKIHIEVNCILNSPCPAPYSLISHKQTLLASTGFLLNKGKKIKATDYSVTTNHGRNFM